MRGLLFLTVIGNLIRPCLLASVLYGAMPGMEKVTDQANWHTAFNVKVIPQVLWRCSPGSGEDLQFSVEALERALKFRESPGDHILEHVAKGSSGANGTALISWTTNRGCPPLVLRMILCRPFLGRPGFAAVALSAQCQRLRCFLAPAAKHQMVPIRIGGGLHRGER